MLQIDCENPTIRISLPACVALITLATLSRAGFETFVLAATLVPPDGVTFNGVPAGIARGVWQLSFETDCGCFSAPVFVDICRAPAFQSTHQPTSDQPPTQVCCPDPEPIE